MGQNKTIPTAVKVADFLDKVPDSKRREDSKQLCAFLQRLTGEDPVMWGPSLVGFGRYHYKYASGREGDAPIVGFAPRARELVLYLCCYGDWTGPLLDRLGPHKAGKGCLYIKSLADVDEGVLAELVECSSAEIAERYPGQ
jgi:hypothetical protein